MRKRPPHPWSPRPNQLHYNQSQTGRCRCAVTIVGGISLAGISAAATWRCQTPAGAIHRPLRILCATRNQSKVRLIKRQRSSRAIKSLPGSIDIGFSAAFGHQYLRPVAPWVVMSNAAHWTGLPAHLAGEAPHHLVFNSAPGAHG